MTKSEAVTILADVIRSLLEKDDPDTTAETLASGIMESLGVDQEWAIAEYDSLGRLDSVMRPGYEFGHVFQHYRNLSESVAVDRSVGIVTRLVTDWSKV